jgi:hypothetical protein
MNTSNLPSHAVRFRRFFYGNQPDEVGIAFVGSLAECREFMGQDAESIYRTRHNESGPWRLRIVNTSSLRPYAIQQAEDAMQEQIYREACGYRV